MRKFRLIKTYPNSPKLGYISDNKDSRYNCKEYPEFWKEIVKKEYEILKIKAKSNHPNIPVNKVVDSWVNVNLDYFDIYSIKRLSDGEVFTVGDKINYEVINSNKNRIITSVINNFYIDLNNNLRINFNLDRKNINTNCYLKDLIIYKKPLFITEDGVDIYEGDKFWYVNNIHLPDGFYLTETIAKKGNPDSVKVETCKDFSTKEAAEEYILMNKPCLSINDLIQRRFAFVDLKYLKELVKSKL